MARLRRSKRIATSAAKIASQSGATDNDEAREEQETFGIHRGTTARKRPAPVEDVLSGLPNVTRRRRKIGLKAPRRREDQAYKPLAEEESGELEQSEKGQASPTVEEGLDIDQSTAPKKAKALKSVRFEDLSPERLQKTTHRRPRSEYKEFSRGDDLEEGFPSDTSDREVQGFVSRDSQVKVGNTRDQMVENEVTHSRKTTRLHRRTDVE